MLHSVPLHIRVSPDTRQRLQRLRSERHLNVGSWLRALIDQALDREFGPPPPAAEEPLAPVKAAPPDPIPGWTPAKVKGGVWGARFQGDIRTLPADLDGRTISVTASSGDSWNANRYRGRRAVPGPPPGPHPKTMRDRGDPDRQRTLTRVLLP